VFWQRGTKERVRPVEIGLRWDVGAPLPHLLQSEWRTFLAFYLDEPDPTWDGTWVNVVDPTSGEPALIGVIEWLRCTGAVLGGLNDEAYHGHRLWDQGLSKVGGHGAAEVEGSAWIAELERSNRVHEHHRPEAFTGYRHFILGFHDSTFECVAEGFRAFRVRDSMPHVLGVLAASIDERAELPFEEVGKG
jgi:hypothetical protein